MEAGRRLSVRISVHPGSSVKRPRHNMTDWMDTELTHDTLEVPGSLRAGISGAFLVLVGSSAPGPLGRESRGPTASMRHILLIPPSAVTKDPLSWLLGEEPLSNAWLKGAPAGIWGPEHAKNDALLGQGGF
jgi:hypothetical protein